MLETMLQQTIQDIGNSVKENLKADDNKLLTQEELAKVIGVSVSSLNKYFVLNDDFPVIMVGSKRRYPRKEVDLWLHKHTKTIKEVR